MAKFWFGLSIPFPPGFTPEREFQHVDAQEVQDQAMLLVGVYIAPQSITRSVRFGANISSPYSAVGMVHCMVWGDFNEVRCMEDRLGSVYNAQGGVESSQLALLQTYIEGTLLSNMEDRWVWDLNGEGVFWVKDVRILLDECFLPKAPTATRWVKYVPIKINFLLGRFLALVPSVADWIRISSGSFAACGLESIMEPLWFICWMA
ncbi:hypothetical protein Tco_0760377 [Tanacetum coccineum]